MHKRIVTDLFSWLHNHSYFVSTNTTSVVQDYCNRSNVYFVVNRINLTNRYTTETEINQAINELQKGIATPLQITFQPGTLFYPLQLTSINQGNTKINVYVITDYYVQDGSNILLIEDVETSYFGKEYGEHITWLTFDGPTSELTKDSFFHKKTVSP